jgi:hypothetical protein
MQNGTKLDGLFAKLYDADINTLYFTRSDGTPHSFSVGALLPGGECAGWLRVAKRSERKRALAALKARA